MIGCCCAAIPEAGLIPLIWARSGPTWPGIRLALICSTMPMLGLSGMFIPPLLIIGCVIAPDGGIPVYELHVLIL